MSVTFNGAAGSIILPNPELGDADQFNLGTIYKVTMSKTIHSTKQNSVISTFLLTFTNLLQTEYEAFALWFEGSRNASITYTDYNGDDYIGIIKNQPLEITVDGKRECLPNNYERASITIEFEAQR